MEKYIKEFEELFVECDNHYQFQYDDGEMLKVLDFFRSVVNKMKLEFLSNQRNKLNREISSLKKATLN